MDLSRFLFLLRGEDLQVEGQLFAGLEGNGFEGLAVQRILRMVGGYGGSAFRGSSRLRD